MRDAAPRAASAAMPDAAAAIYLHVDARTFDALIRHRFSMLRSILMPTQPLDYSLISCIRFDADARCAIFMRHSSLT